MSIFTRSHLIKFVSRKILQLKKLEANLRRKISVPEETFFDDLTPVDNIDQKAYDQALNWALHNERIKNIALTGPYGSGKSSILKTFEHRHPEYEYLHISLATFKELKDDAEQNKNATASDASIKTEDQQLIELSILQQIFYKVSANDIPNSRFKRIKSNPGINRLAFLSELLVFIVCISLNWFTYRFLAFWGIDDIQFQLTSIPRAILSSVIVLIFFHWLWLALKGLSNSRFVKISITGNELELNTEESSILNRHIDEILYFFQETEYDVVIIEDLDRFNEPEVFTKLRELNNLINNSKQVGRRVRFIYAIKDDMFQDKSRTKFFDFIIPVIPVINSSNSQEILLKKNEIAKLNLAPKLLSDITLYIDDMRVLKNIFNEYLIYENNLKKIAINQNKLFATIVYKNIYPTDFAILHYNQGMIYNAFSRDKQKITDRITQTKTNKIKDLQNRLQKIQLTISDNLIEIRSRYAMAIMGKIPQFSVVSKK